MTIRGKKDKDPKQREDKEEESEETRAKTMFTEQEQMVNDELKKISEIKNGKAGQIWEIRKKVIGGKKGDNLATAIEDPVTKKLITNKNLIKETILKYCIQTLSYNEIEERFKEEIEKKDIIVKNL